MNHHIKTALTAVATIFIVALVAGALGVWSYVFQPWQAFTGKSTTATS